MRFPCIRWWSGLISVAVESFLLFYGSVSVLLEIINKTGDGIKIPTSEMMIAGTYINSDFVLRDNGQLEKLIKDLLFNPLIFTLLRAPVPRDKKLCHTSCNRWRPAP